MPTSGHEPKAPERREAPSTPASEAEFTVPEGYTLVKQDEHDAQGGELRRVKRELKQRREADEERERTERERAAKEAGDFDKLAGIEKERREAAERRARKAELGEALRDEIMGRGFSGEQAKAIKKLVDDSSVQYDDDGPVDASVMAAVDRVLASYPNLFGGKPPTQNGGEESPAKPRPRGPSTPPAEAGNRQLPSDFISREEYAATPWEIRMTEDFQAKAKKSEPHWPKIVHRSAFEPANE